MILDKHRILASLCRDSFYEFVKNFWGEIIHDPPVLNWHIKFICDEMQKMAERVFKGEKKKYDLLINIPPGSTKSTICSQMFIAWVWTRMPHAQFICVCYAEQMAIKDAEHTRDLINSDLYRKCFPEISIRHDKEAKTMFENHQGGWRMAVGMDGQITGQHAHFVLIDDPIDPKKSLSDAERKNVMHVMNSILPSRVVNREVSVFTLIQQRVHQADPSGEWLQSGRPLRHICLPGELTDGVMPPEMKEYYVDGLFDPIRYSKNVLQSFRSPDSLGEYGYASQILQSPIPLSGGMFKVDKINEFDDEPEQIRWAALVRSWDKAGTKDGGAWTVGVLMGLDTKGRWWILDVVREQVEATEREALIDSTAMEDGPEVSVIVEMEGGSGGKESAQGTVNRLVKMGFRCSKYLVTGQGDKVARAYQFANQAGSGNVNILKRSWTKAFKEELRFFPDSKFKDQVDASSGAFNHLFKPRPVIGGMRVLAR